MMTEGARLDYVELPAAETLASREFFRDAFGFDFTDYGPSYSSSRSGGTELGLSADAAPAPMPGFHVTDLEAAREKVMAAGGIVERDIYAFPGGRRFEFSDPGGNRLLVFVYED